MILRILIVIAILLPGTSSLRAEEIALTYGQAPDRPVMYEDFDLVEEDEEAWEDGEGVLTDRAVTLYAYFDIAGMDDGLILSYDFSSAAARKPDILYADVNMNLCLDGGERFPLRPARMPGNDYPPGTDFPLCAEKLSLAAIAREECVPFFINVYAIPVAGDSAYALVPMWYEAWGCCRGGVTIDGKAWDIVLRDQNVNGSFTDFEGKGRGGFDTLRLLPAEADGLSTEADGGQASFAQPLRERMLLGGRAFTVALSENGRKITLTPFDAEFGTVAAPAGDVEVSLSSPEWGTHTVAAGGTLALPVGEWKISCFRRIVAATGAFCKYMGPEKIGLKISRGETAIVPALKTTLTPSVVMRGKGKKKRALSLVLTTEQGATFKDYENPAADSPFKGVPLKITDQSGRTVVEGYFPFG
jgi:hypothetical protein